MASHGKRIKALKQEVEALKQYELVSAIEKAKSLSNEKFPSSMDVVFKIGVDPRKYMVKGVSQLPHGTGKTVKVIVFAEADQADAATAAGADLVGYEQLIDDIKSGEVNVSQYDVCIAVPAAMKLLGKVAKILGPKGMMPNAKLGTVTPDVASAVSNVKKGQVKFTVEKGSLVHCQIGRVSFESSQLAENIQQLVSDLKKAKPSAAKGQYLQKMHISTTMGPGIQVDLSTVS
ncbi:50S ribosomal protein L1 [Gammaproteobacteria bacterium]|nr:50S ribosomal protein L1 [Gammaproteobacteria bacterium]